MVIKHHYYIIQIMINCKVMFMIWLLFLILMN